MILATVFMRAFSLQQRESPSANRWGKKEPRPQRTGEKRNSSFSRQLACLANLSAGFSTISMLGPRFGGLRTVTWPVIFNGCERGHRHSFRHRARRPVNMNDADR